MNICLDQDTANLNNAQPNTIILKYGGILNER